MTNTTEMLPAAAAVFGTFELLEDILIRVPKLDILLAAKVCLYWQELVEDSPLIRDKMWPMRYSKRRTRSRTSGCKVHQDNRSGCSGDPPPSYMESISANMMPDAPRSRPSENTTNSRARLTEDEQIMEMIGTRPYGEIPQVKEEYMSSGHSGKNSLHRHRKSIWHFYAGRHLNDSVE